MAIHVIVFAGIGITTGRWSLLMIFIPAVVVTMFAKWLLTQYAIRHPEKKRLRRWLLREEENQDDK